MTMKHHLTCLMLAVLALVAGTGGARAQSAPSWWNSRGVITPGASADDYAVVNQGQVKQLVKAAADEITFKLGASSQSYWTQLTGLISSWQSATSATDDYAAVSVGQLKAVALPCYQRLKDAGKISTLPTWATQAGSDDYATANIGQAKALFAFSP
jgi:hypothetical protein